jgi:redox-sensing transcriptional repressor
MGTEHVPEQTIGRLPIYLRCLIQARALGMGLVNSLQLAQMAGTNAAQVRKDLSFLGELGTRGLGYDIEALTAHISSVLGLTETRRVAIVGFGRLGGALLGYPGFAERGFEIVAVFDADRSKVGMPVDRRGVVRSGLTVRPTDALEQDLRDLSVEIVVLATPQEAAQEMAERVAAAGVRAILNFAPVRIDPGPDVRVRQVDMSAELQVLSFYLARIGRRAHVEEPVPGRPPSVGTPS